MPKLNELIRGNELIVAPVALNPIMARLAEEAGFKFKEIIALNS